MTVYMPVRVAWRYCAENYHEQLSIVDDLPVTLIPVALRDSVGADAAPPAEPSTSGANPTESLSASGVLTEGSSDRRVDALASDADGWLCTGVFISPGGTTAPSVSAPQMSEAGTKAKLASDPCGGTRPAPATNQTTNGTRRPTYPGSAAGASQERL